MILKLIINDTWLLKLFFHRNLLQSALSCHFKLSLRDLVSLTNWRPKHQIVIFVFFSHNTQMQYVSEKLDPIFASKYCWISYSRMFVNWNPFKGRVTFDRQHFNKQWKLPSYIYVNDIVLLFLLVTSNTFHTFF